MVISPLVRRYGRKAYFGALITTDRLFGQRFEMIPRLCRWDGKNASELKKTGEMFLDYFVKVWGLKPNARILDVGSGISRIAVPLTHYLTKDGSYEGLDIIPEAIRWCGMKISPLYPNFRFQLADIANSHYNPDGTLRAADYSFPYSDSSFDFVFLGSVFTHLLPREMERYLYETARVLKVGGKTLITFFLLTPETLSRIERGESTLPFAYDGEGFKTVSEQVPEKALAYDESYINRLYERNRLSIVSPIRYGTWSYAVSDFEYQDFVLAEKANS